MNVYDFDNTLYDGESAFDFFIFCVKHKPKLLRLLPLITAKLIKYKLCLISIDELKEYVEKYAKEIIDDFENLDDILELFWQKNIKKIKSFYFSQHKPDDIILSASFGFLLKIPAERLGIKTVISSEINLETGELLRLCFRDKKTEILKEYISADEKVCFYTDSMNDKSMIDFASQAFLVKGKKIKKLK